MRHIGFECIAGYLHQSNLLSQLQDEEDSAARELSSDEEYFISKPNDPIPQTPSAPRNAEEAKELEELMERIYEFNTRTIK